jgi:CRP/FNR family transcriptional regulator, cyclic AMP receptor protein
MNESRGSGQNLWHRSSSSLQSSSLNKHHAIRNFEHKNINIEHDERLTVGQKIADTIAAFSGSMSFLFINLFTFAMWILVNTAEPEKYHKDPYPYQFLTMAVSLEAIFLSIFVLISQNRQAAKDRLAAEQDYKINIKSEIEVSQTLDRIEKQEKLILQLLDKREVQEKREVKMLESINVLITRTGRDYYS